MALFLLGEIGEILELYVSRQVLVVTTYSQRPLRLLLVRDGFKIFSLHGRFKKLNLDVSSF